MGQNELEVVRNHNYTISVRDSKKREIVFRDITGADLEYLDSIISEKEDDSDARVLNFENIQDILGLLSIEDVNFGQLTRKTIVEVFSCVKENILCNYLPKYKWLQICYGIQNGSFAGVSLMETVPMTKFVAMAQIHKEAIDSMKND